MKPFQFTAWSEQPPVEKDKAKLALAEAMPRLLTDDEVIVIDPDADPTPLLEQENVAPRKITDFSKAYRGLSVQFPCGNYHPSLKNCPFISKDIYEIEATLRQALSRRSDSSDDLCEGYIQAYLDKLRDGTHNCSGCPNLKL